MLTVYSPLPATQAASSIPTGPRRSTADPLLLPRALGRWPPGSPGCLPGGHFSPHTLAVAAPSPSGLSAHLGSPPSTDPEAARCAPRELTTWMLLSRESDALRSGPLGRPPALWTPHADTTEPSRPVPSAGSDPAGPCRAFLLACL